MVSHLSNLNHLSLSGNLCINRDFVDSPSKTVIESELRNCGHNYLISAIELLDSESSIDEKFSSFGKQLEKKFERKFELITDLFYHLDERNEENSKQIEEIKHMVDKIFDMLSRK
jgi:divalent metal cation (Fe/Co/Zn/Cd) transporter